MHAPTLNLTKLKNKKFKFFTLALFFYSTLVIFAATGPGSTSDTGDYEGDDPVPTTKQAAPLPIDDYIWGLALIGMMYGFIKFRTYQNSKIE
jgi:hypothetical protein